MSSFRSGNFEFALDREGASVDDHETIELDVDYETVGIDPDEAPEQIGRRLSTLLTTEVVDEEGIFDLIVREEGRIVAALVIACEEDAIALGGERVSGIDDETIASALVDALRG
ncbi:MAG: hypothetical protein HOW73_31265 [Polyangiaceae bacterium]|nr:hypothetical protein [Polyangiaceae bacterium]